MVELLTLNWPSQRHPVRHLPNRLCPWFGTENIRYGLQPVRRLWLTAPLTARLMVRYSLHEAVDEVAPVGCVPELFCHIAQF